MNEERNGLNFVNCKGRVFSSDKESLIKQYRSNLRQNYELEFRLRFNNIQQRLTVVVPSHG